jgi:hypothetical protein
MYNSIKVDNKILNITASNISLSYDFIKSTERTLDGSMFVDNNKRKQRVQILFDILDKEQFDTVQQVFVFF